MTEGATKAAGFFLDRFPIAVRPGHLADRLADGADSLPRRARADKGPAVLGRVTPADGVSQEIEALLGHPTDARLLFVDR